MNFSITIGSLLSTALIAGLFFTWSNAIMPGLRKLPAHDFLLVMQTVNRSILNPLFLLLFFSPVFLLSAKMYLQFKEGISLSFWLLLLAALCYIFGVFILTIVVHIPINEALNKLNIQSATPDELAKYKLLFQSRWIPYNTIRALCAFISFLLLAVALIEKN